MTFPSINLPYSLLKIHSGNISRSNKSDGFIIFLERYFSIDLDTCLLLNLKKDLILKLFYE